jgi:hypothetical protein
MDGYLPYEDEIEKNLKDAIYKALSYHSIEPFRCLQSFLGVVKDSPSYDGLCKDIKAEVVWNIIK